MFFNGEKEGPGPLEFEPKRFQGGDESVVKQVAEMKEETGGQRVMWMMVGSPGAGKSSFAEIHLPRWNRVNRDTLKTKDKCLKVAAGHMAAKVDLVIDNTNPKVSDRAAFLALAKKHGYQARSIHLVRDRTLCQHMDKQRVFNPHRRHLSGKAGRIPIMTWFKYFEEPTLKEGFKAVHSFEFQP